MDALSEFPPEFARALHASYSFLCAINIRLKPCERRPARYWRFAYIAPCVALLAASASVDVCLLLRAGRLVEAAARLPAFLIMIQGVLKGAVLLPQRRDIARLVARLAALWRADLGADHRALRDHLVGRLNLCNRVNYWFALVGTSQYLLTPLAQALVQSLAQSARGAASRPLPMAARFPFDPAASWPLYLAVYAFQFYSMFVCMLAYIGAELLMVSLMALLSAEFSLLRAALLQPCLSRAALVSLVRRHQHLLRLSEQFDKIFNKLVFIDLMFVGGTTCFFRFAAQFSRGAADSLNNYAGVLSSQLYVLCVCYYGDQLSAASGSVADAAYDTPWYEEDDQYTTIIFMIIKRAQKACCLSSLKYAPVSLPMFTKVMSTTWSYFSLMNSVYEEQE